MWRSQALFVIGLALLAAFSAFPLDDPGRAAAGGCTRSARPGALQAAVDTASIGETICLEAGVYRGPVIFSRKSGVTLRGQGAATIIAGGSADGIVALDSDNLTFEDLKLFFGHPANAYVGNSRNVTFQRIDAGGGGIGIHFDNGSSGRVGESFIYAMEGDGVLIRRGSNVNVERNWIFVNGGVGVSMVGQGASASIVRNIISDNRASGVFVGQPPCAGLPPGRVEAPQCFIANPPGFVASTTVTLDTNVVQASGGTGVVLFPGTLATLRGNRFWRNRFTGLFAWGATVNSAGRSAAARGFCGTTCTTAWRSA